MVKLSQDMDPRKNIRGLSTTGSLGKIGDGPGIPPETWIIGIDLD